MKKRIDYYNRFLENIDTIPRVLGASVLLFLSLSIIVLFVWRGYVQQKKQESQQIINAEVSFINSAIQNRIGVYVEALRSGVALFNASDTVSRDEWHIFANNLDLQKNFPGMQGYGYAKVIPKQELTEHIKSVRAEGFEDYSIRPLEDKEEYTSIIYLEPFDERNQQAFGLDMTFEENRRTAMKVARETGNAQMSGPVTLVQEIDEDVQVGFLIYLPHYKKGINYKNQEERIANIEGYVYSPFRMNDLIKGVFSKNDTHLDFTIFDKETNSKMYSYIRNESEVDSKIKDTLESLSAYDEIQVANKTWSIEYSVNSEFAQKVNYKKESTIIIIIGLALSGFITSSFYLLTTSRIRAREMAKQMTIELRKKVATIEQAEQEMRTLMARMKEEHDSAEKQKKRLETVHSIITISKVSVQERFERMLKLVCEELGLDFGIISNIQNNIYTIAYGHATNPKNKPQVGMQLDVKTETYCSITCETNQLFATGKMSEKYSNHPFFKKWQAETYIGVPLEVNGRFFGTLNFTQAKARKKAFSKSEKQLIRLVARWVERTLEEKAVDQAKTEFVSLASHQLRTPLTTTQWYIELLLNKKTGALNKMQKTYLKEVQEGTNRMIDLVNALLNVSRIELGRFEVIPSDIRISQLINDVLTDLQSLIKRKKSVQVSVDTIKAPDIYRGDKKLLFIIFQNLISNAVKYTDKGEVKVTVESRRNKLHIEVSDEGYGIPKKQQKQIFTKLFRADNVKLYDHTGSGLGLYIVKAIVEDAGGKTSFTSKENKGTTFKIDLPLKGMRAKKGARALE